MCDYRCHEKSKAGIKLSMRPFAGGLCKMIPVKVYYPTNQGSGVLQGETQDHRADIVMLSATTRGIPWNRGIGMLAVWFT